MPISVWILTFGKKRIKIRSQLQKNFVGSLRYKETAEEIKSSIHQILKLCEKSSDDFNAVDFPRVLNHLNSIDFNDSYYLELASLKNWKIVTDDRDFVRYKNHDCTVITMP